ncbi:Solute carrier family 12 member 2 [Trichinella pseudospiralis]|uniref:Solute carrier family 12 member 2 n=2 Tax=Trichinella pseudospiralis TaxID=6337 RepID=A0A0V1DWH9_TRIPS|nr:Solute carrier family 12 member 2 [Trichinella pseudospiralis]
MYKKNLNNFPSSIMAKDPEKTSEEPIFYSHSSQKLSEPNFVSRTVSMDMEMQAPTIRIYQKELLKKRLSRPSLTDLHESIDYISVSEGSLFDEPDVSTDGPNAGTFKPPDAKVKFGWIRGVLIRCILNILGATLYLRLGWVAGQAGIGFGTLIVLFSTVITTLTALSMCALCTNGEIQGGGAYFMLSRSLGPEFGGSMGMIFGFADAAYSAMNVIGFADSIQFWLNQADLKVIDGGINDVRIIGALTQLFLFTVVMISVTWESKTELALLVIISISYVTFIVGTFLPPTELKAARGMTGYSLSTFYENFLPGWYGEDVFTVFGVYLPSVTGIMAGAGISGDLAEPNRSIPKGTLLAILLTTILYLSGIWLTGATCLRNASGNITDLYNGNLTACAATGTCSYGLLHDNQVMEMESAFGPLVSAGIFATCLSSSLTCLISSPRTIQAVCKDRLYPYIHVFGQGSGSMQEPRRATILVAVIGLAVIAVGDLNTVAPLISNLYLASFALINYACFDGSLARSPGWRPAFKYYNMWLSLLGAVLCIAAMFILHWATALVTLAIISSLYVYLLHRRPAVNWGSSGQAHIYTKALHDMLHLMSTEEHVKNYRPQVLVLAGNPVTRPCMLDFVRSITKDISLMVCGHVIVLENPSEICYMLNQWMVLMYGWLRRRKIKAFYAPVVIDNFNNGIEMLFQMSGMGKLCPNIVFLGYKSDWRTCSKKEMSNYFGIIHECFNHDMALCILRLSSGFDFSDFIEKHDSDGAELLNPLMIKQFYRPRISTDDLSTLNNGNSCNKIASTETAEKSANANKEPIAKLKKLLNSGIIFEKDKIPKRPVNNKQSIAAKGLSVAINQFRRKRKDATIDVWWLSDDGGLTLLISHLLTQTKSYLEGAKLRVFTKAQNVDNIVEEEKNLKALLAKFRISYASVYVLPDLLTMPAKVTVDKFHNLLKAYMVDENSSNYDFQLGDLFITDEHLRNLQGRINRHLLAYELLQKHSKEATLIVVSLPVPRKGREPAYLYMAFLEMLSQDLPPVLFVRGNQKTVLTFYS